MPNLIGTIGAGSPWTPDSHRRVVRHRHDRPAVRPVADADLLLRLLTEAWIARAAIDSRDLLELGDP